MKGRSRSAAFVVAYIMYKMKYSLDEAIEFVIQRRPQVYPNGGFIDQLRDYERELKQEFVSLETEEIL
jgi:protein-tyrosine phosphatase